MTGDETVFKSIGFGLVKDVDGEGTELTKQDNVGIPNVYVS